jgi:murein L,D-transpeptidase YcbB/YkuD
LHDTNQRSLFGNDYRSLSHGCVRVQNWEGLYKYVLRADSIQAIKQAEKYTSIDSVHRWLSEHKRTVIPLKTQLPIYFRYYTAAGKKGKLEVYNDVYNYDRPFREQIMNSLR